jgi:transposase
MLVCARNSPKGLSQRQLAKTFCLSRACVQKYLALTARTLTCQCTSCSPPTQRTCPSAAHINAALAHRRSDKRSPIIAQVLRDAIAERAELYLDELQQLLRERANVEVSVSTVCRWLQLLKLPRKRASRVALARVSDRVQQLRDNFASNVQPRLPSAVGRLIASMSRMSMSAVRSDDTHVHRPVSPLWWRSRTMAVQHEAIASLSCPP